MKSSRLLTLLLVVVVAVSVVASVAGAQGDGGSKPEAADVGISDSEIRVGVVADVENPIAPGVFQGSVDGVKGWAAYMNAHGGLAGRKVVIDFYDSKLSASEARNGIIAACQKDFAMVGTSAVFVNNVDDLVGCRDQAGAATGIPDIPVVTTEVVHQCSPVTFPVNPPNLDCSTKDEDNQTWRSAASRVQWYQKKYGKKALHGPYMASSDLKSTMNTCIGSSAGYRVLGIAEDRFIGISARAPQSMYTPYVRQMRDDQSNYVYNCAPISSLIALRREADIQGVTPQVKVWDCPQTCYDKVFVAEGGAAVNDQYAGLFFLPFDEGKQNEMTGQFVKYVGKGKTTGFGANAWTAGIALRDAVDNVVKSGTPVTRAAVLEELGSLNGFTADGMAARIDLGRRIPSACYVLVQLQDGKWKRVNPTKKGTFACSKSGLVTLEYNPTTGAVTTTSGKPVPGP